MWADLGLHCCFRAHRICLRKKCMMITYMNWNVLVLSSFPFSSLNTSCVTMQKVLAFTLYYPQPALYLSVHHVSLVKGRVQCFFVFFGLFLCVVWSFFPGSSNIFWGKLSISVPFILMAVAWLVFSAPEVRELYAAFWKHFFESFSWVVNAIWLIMLELMSFSSMTTDTNKVNIIL